MKMDEFIRALRSSLDTSTEACTDSTAETLLEMLYDIYTQFNGFDNETIRKDFEDIYAAMNGKPIREIDTVINPVCILCRDCEKVSFTEGVRVGIRLAKEIDIV